MKIEAGKRYKLRSGAIVTIVGKRTYNYSSSTKRHSFWVGCYATGEGGYTCQEDGNYAPDVGVHPHMLDIVEVLP